MAEETRRAEDTAQDFTAHSKEGAIIDEIVEDDAGESAPLPTKETTVLDEAPVAAPSKAESAQTAKSKQPHALAKIDEENLHEPDEVQPKDAAPPQEPQPDEPVEVEELRKSEKETHPEQAAVSPERKLGPLTPSMWVLSISVVAFVFAFFGWLGSL